MKQLFLLLRSLLITVDSIKWVDLDKGQLNQYDTRPPIDFPAVLIKISLPNTSKLSKTEQQCNALIKISIAFAADGDTDSSTPEDILEQSLQIYDTAQSIHELLQGFIDINIIRSPLDRVSVVDPSRPDQIKVLEYTYSTRIID